MSEAHEIQATEIDNPEDDVRRAIEDLKIETPVEARIVVDNSSKFDRARDEEGKFAKEAKDRKIITLPEKDAGVKVDAPAIGAPAPAEVAPVVAPAATYKAPDSWKAELKTKFAELPPEVQAEISRRENDITKGLSKQDDERLFGRKVSEVVAPYLPTIRMEGGTPEQAISQLLQTAHTLRQGDAHQRASAVAAVMQQFKVDPQALFSILQGGNSTIASQAPQPGLGPQDVQRLVQEQLAQERQLQEQRSTEGQIAEFSAKPGHEHFEKVRVHMGAMYDAGVSTDLEDLYQRACYADPEIRDSLIASKIGATTGQRITELKATTERAKSAAVSVTGSPGGAKRPTNGAANPLSSIEDDLRASIRELDGRV